MVTSLGSRLRRLRTERDISLSELSRRSGIGKGTISELEHDRRGARLDTLFALTTALDAPLGALLPETGADHAARFTGASVSAILLDRWEDNAGLVEFYRATLSVDRQDSHAHAAGIKETVTTVRGCVLIGQVGRERELHEGESLQYPGDVPHSFQAIGKSAEIVLLMHYPHHTEERRNHDDR